MYIFALHHAFLFDYVKSLFFIFSGCDRDDKELGTGSTSYLSFVALCLFNSIIYRSLFDAFFRNIV